jgi:hypothetical protein
LAHVALDAGLAIKTCGDRLVIAAMLGLGTPVGLDAHLVERLGVRPPADRHQQRTRRGPHGKTEGGSTSQAI